jgi:signal peptidase II
MREKAEGRKGRVMKRKLVFLFAVVLSVVALDQFTKHLVTTHFKEFSSVPVLGDYVRLTFIYNQNGAFGLKPHHILPFLSVKVFFAIFNILAVGLVLWMYFKTRAGDWWTETALVLILGGAAGNFIDRIRFGRVIDFIDCDFPDFIMDRFPIFNVADSCITVGVFIIIITTLLARKHGSPDKQER